MYKEAVFLVAFLLLSNVQHIFSNVFADEDKPNLVVIYTDEHSYRTIGAYRQLLSNEQAFIWGDGVKVDTPHLDSLADDGAIFTNFYVAAPLCTPSRATFLTGLYPYHTGAHLNHLRMHGNVTTWAEVLRRRNYHTGFVGKFHLNGAAKPGWKEQDRKFGFKNTLYQYNRGHWKFFEKPDQQFGEPSEYEWTDESAAKFSGTMEENYATDFLFDRGIEIIDDALERGKRFAVMLSIPDPHAPNTVRPPYDTMYDHFDFKVPKTAWSALHKKPALPGWSSTPIQAEPDNADDVIKELEESEKRQVYFRNIFGMVKLIDDNVGKMLNYLKEKGLEENTIVVFSSDHGDMLEEHGKHNKGKPYDTAAGVPFLIRYPAKIKPGKIIETAYSSIDFAPTILNLMGVTNYDVDFQGIDGSDEIMSDDLNSLNPDQIRFITDSKEAKWAAAVNNRYKLVLSIDVPWFIDRKRDADELINFFTDSSYTKVINDMKELLYDTMKPNGFTLMETTSFYYDQPSCSDQKDQLEAFEYRVCSDLKEPQFVVGCHHRRISDNCPVACDACECEDSVGYLSWGSVLKTCDELVQHCNNKRVRLFCPMTCESCV
mmetsp:Transcript_14596/g.17762  ORF Transcript_14596/g.17762 Transcript_14596/m.17762 type:complete len:599 (-) Transcript_14596:188-1984(-)